MPKHLKVMSKETTEKLDHALLERDVQQCLSLLDRDITADRCAALPDEDAVRLLLCVAQVFDLGYGDPSQLELYLR